MKKVKQYFLQHIDIIAVFVVSFIFSFFSFWNVCTIYPHGDFDSQALTVWNYNAIIGMLPYKDIFFPYGFLQYWKDHQPIWNFIYICLLPILVTTLYFIINQIVKRKMFALCILFLFSIFITVFTGWETFNRYGILTISTLYFAWYLYTHKKLSSMVIVLCGLACGLLFSLVTDQGIYVIFFFLIMLGITFLVRREKIVGKQMLLFLGGCTLGILPLIYFLVTHHMVANFISGLLQLSNLNLYAKTPFLPGSKTAENIFVFSILYITIFFLTVLLIRKKGKYSLITILELALIGVLIFLEQKNLMRSIDRQLTFIGLLLFIFLFIDIFYLKLKRKIFVIVVGCYFLLLMVLFHPYQPPTIKIRGIANTACLQQNIANSSYKSLYRTIKNNILSINQKAKIFSYPSDPMLYAFFNQIPPYYSNTYDASSIDAQNKQINYIEKNNINFVVINSNITAIQDGVPEYMRSRLLLQYILTHFQPIANVKQYIVLQKSTKGTDIAQNKIMNQDYKQFLLSPDLGNIPSIQREQTKPQKMFYSLAALNSFLAKNTIQTKNITLLLFPKDKQTVYTVTFETIDKEKTTVSFKNCRKNFPCAIDFSLIPLFYEDKILQSISSKNNFEVYL